MERLSEQLNQLSFLVKEKVGPKSERATIVQDFVDEINSERKATGWPRMVTGRGIAMKCSHLKNNFELYSFLSECRDYQKRNGSFGKYFFGALKIK